MSNPHQSPASSRERLPGGDSAAATSSRPTHVRFLIVAITTLSAVTLYLDRVCLGQAEKAISRDLSLSETDTGWLLSAFFWAYALCQVPSGWISDRFGARWMLGFYIIAWSGFTAAFGLANSLGMMIALRLCVGVAQAGAYPTSGAILRRWIEFPRRGTASGVVSVGGRLGGAIAPWATGALILYLGDWRPALVIYGVVGLVVGLLFITIFRERPSEHPWCNAAEVALVQGSQAVNSRPLDTPEHFGHVLKRMVASFGMWMMCVAQFLTNIGWVFLITWMPRYLKSLGMTEEQSGRAGFIVLGVGMLGMFLGGPLTDLLTHKFGVRWGRALPFSLTRFAAATGFLACLVFPNPWVQVAAFTLVAVATDLGTPATWAYMQDVGGKYVGGVLGWGNMWGNFGAALSPILFPLIAGRSEVTDAAAGATAFNWPLVFSVAAGAFIIAGLSALFIDARERISVSD